MNHSKLRDIVTLACFLSACLISRAFLILSRGFEIFHADHAVMGLMGKHILEGHPMIYYYGQGYMGSLEAFMAALLYCFFGMNLFTIQAAPLVFYLLFIGVTFFLVKKTCGYGVSLLTGILLVLTPPAMTLLSITALGGYPETLFFGSILLLGFTLNKEKPALSTLFWTGMAAGTGFWVNNLIVLYFLPILVLFFLQSPAWEGKNFRDLKDVFLLKNLAIPTALKWAAIAFHSYILFLILWNLLGFWAGKNDLSIGPLTLPLPHPIFHVKKVKKILMILAVVWMALFFLHKKFAESWKALRGKLPFAVGFVCGAFPMFLFSLMGGKGYRVVHGSSIIQAKELPSQIHSVIFQGLLQSVLGIPIDALTSWQGDLSYYAWGLFALFAGLTLAYLIHHQKEIRNLLCLEGRGYPYSFFPFLLILSTITVCLLTTLKADRYLYPAYFAFCFVFAWSLRKLYDSRRLWLVLILSCLLLSRIYTNLDLVISIYRQDHLQNGYENVIDFLKKENISGGYAIYVRSYPLTFLSREKIILAPYRSPDRYPPYTRYADGLSRVAYVFHDKDEPFAHFRRALAENGIPYRKTRVGPLWVYTIDRREKSEKGFV